MKKLLVLAATLVAVAAPAAAQNVTVKMLNRGATGSMVFEPAFVRVKPGTTVTFEATNPTHMAETIPGMLPAGAKEFKGQMNKSVSVKFDRPGVYGVKCLPHLAMGMIALVQVGDKSPNLAQVQQLAQRLPPLARKRMTPLLAQAR